MTQSHHSQEHQLGNSQPWMCEASKKGSLVEEKCIHDRPLNEFEYFLEHLPEDKFEPFEWTHILAALYVFTNEITQTQFCGEKGNDIISLCTIRVSALEEGEKIQESGST